MTIDFKSRFLLTAALLGACATHTLVPPPTGPVPAPEPEPGLYAITIGRLVKIGDPRELAPSPALTRIAAMTYDPATRRLYAVTNTQSQPRLIAVNPTTGEAEVIAPIESPDLKLKLVESLTVDPRSGTLFAAGGDSTFASNVLLTVDPATGRARQVAQIRGTIQREVDAMTFVDTTIFSIDGAGNSSALYRLDPQLGQATRVATPFPRTVSDLAFDPASRRLYAVQSPDGRLLTISLDGQQVDVMPAPAGGLSAVAVIPDVKASLFADGFESGDASAWPGNIESQQ
jgi:DNA-binding beta-propeller fold protein YncE